MWQYTTETIINSNKGNLEGGVRFQVYKNTGEVATASDKTNRLVIDGVNTFVADNIKAVYAVAYQDEVNEIATITVPAQTAGDTIRLKVVLRQQGLTSSAYQNAYLKHNKPLFFEIKSAGAAATDAAALVAAIKAQLGMSDFKFFTVENTGAVLTLTAADCYTRFVEISLDKIGAAAGTGEALLGYEDYTNIATGSVTTHGKEGMGTVRQLIKNLRIPTSASTNPFSADQGGKPIPGGKYNQYLIEYETTRRHIGNQVMGAIDTSITSHVFFIEQGIASEFEAALEKVEHQVAAAVLADPTVLKTTIGSVE